MDGEGTELFKRGREYLIEAHRIQRNITPILGAGISIPLGLPTWGRLVDKLEASITSAGSRGSLLEKLTAMREANEFQFNSCVQKFLSLPRSVTSTALQAIVTSGVKRILTTNLDLAVEVAFSKAGHPLAPDQRAVGYEREELKLFTDPGNDPRLLKIHGTIERPSSWVLTKRDYEKAYGEPGKLKEFLASQIKIPLFIGFSFSDEDIAQSFHLSKLKWDTGAFAIVPLELADEKSELFHDLNIRPIPYGSYQSIPEIIDEIFTCQPIPITTQTAIEGEYAGEHRNPTTLTVGAASAPVSHGAKPDSLCAAVVVLRNAFEFQPVQSQVLPHSRRQSGTRGLYLDRLLHLIEKDDEQALEICLAALLQYPETLGDVLNHVTVGKSSWTDDTFFTLLKRLLDTSGDRKSELLQILSRRLHSESIGYFSRRGVAKVLAVELVHPAQKLPPATENVADFTVPKYPLTEHQVSVLLGTSVGRGSVRPHVIENLEEVNQIIIALRRYTTDDRWRLPTEREWAMIASTDDNAWPWGDTMPEYRKHAHLGIRGSGERKGPLEVGIFPAGASKEGIFDLIGNVHELVAKSDADFDPDVIGAGGGDLRQHYKLAGGAYNTRYSGEYPYRFTTTFGTPSRNTGVRPIRANV